MKRIPVGLNLKSTFIAIILFLCVMHIVFLLYKDFRWQKAMKSDRRLGIQPSSRDNGGVIHIVLIFVHSDLRKRIELKERLKVFISSMTEQTIRPLHFHVITDAPNWETVTTTIADNAAQGTEYQLSFIDLDQLKKVYGKTFQVLQHHFGGDALHHKFNDTIFYLSTRIHHILPGNIKKVIMLDVDLKFKKDISLLFAEFSQFSKANIMGMAWDMQPAYRHVFQVYRHLNPGTRLGSPPPDGFPGFNSGVVLFDLAKMRESQVYNAMLQDSAINDLVKKYGDVKGNLGDQDFFNLIGFDHEELIHVLPCIYNRQLCKWWKENGYADVFDLYHKCEGDVAIFHGNCRTPFPGDL